MLASWGGAVFLVLNEVGGCDLPLPPLPFSYLCKIHASSAFVQPSGLVVALLSVC